MIFNPAMPFFHQQLRPCFQASTSHIEACTHVVHVAGQSSRHRNAIYLGSVSDGVVSLVTNHAFKRPLCSGELTHEIRG